ncbi:MAG: serine/threonine-protein kinase, partial [Acidobacteriota bacterium]
MTPERWRQITEIFHAARLQPPAARAALLEKAGAADPSLGLEVKRLLDAYDVGGTIALGDDGPLLAPGETIGPYRIDALIGAGGMGEVYRATDTILKRSVAIKILAPALAADPGWLRRFEREAQTLAALNHPHIAAIYGLAERDGLRALALELVEGRTLADVITSGERPLPVAEALTIARQIASALEATHERGIVHRDLKPGNIAITPAGVVKVLDFGIAKSVEDSGGRSSQGALTYTASEEGLVIGTAAYMSPEQARGLPVNKGSDIWAFGCVLFEMLSGRRPFDGPTKSDTIARVLEREPDWTALPADVPASIRTLLRRCLTKDPAERLHHIADGRLELSDALKTSPPAMRAGGVTRRTMMWSAIAAVIVVLGGAIWWAASRTIGARAPAAVEFGIRFPDNHIPAFGLAVSPDGTQIAAAVFG